MSLVEMLTQQVINKIIQLRDSFSLGNERICGQWRFSCACEQREIGSTFELMMKHGRRTAAICIAETRKDRLAHNFFGFIGTNNVAAAQNVIFESG